MKNITKICNELFSYNKSIFNSNDSLLNKLFYELFNRIGDNGVIALYDIYDDVLNEIYHMSKDGYIKSLFITNDNRRYILHDIMCTINSNFCFDYLDNYHLSNDNYHKYEKEMKKINNDNFYIEDIIYDYNEDLLDNLLSEFVNNNRSLDNPKNIIIIDDYMDKISPRYLNYLSKKYNVIILVLKKENNECVKIIEKYQENINNESKDELDDMFLELEYYSNYYKYDIGVFKAIASNKYFYCCRMFFTYYLEDNEESSV